MLYLLKEKILIVELQYYNKRFSMKNIIENFATDISIENISIKIV